jgi:hypothetical protein
MRQAKAGGPRRAAMVAAESGLLTVLDLPAGR